MSAKTELMLYADDFRKYGDWISICYILGINSAYDKVTLNVSVIDCEYTNLDAEGISNES